MEIPEGLLYTTEHEWMRLDGAEATIGITAYAQEQLGDITFVELPEVGKSVNSPVKFVRLNRSRQPVMFMPHCPVR